MDEFGNEEKTYRELNKDECFKAVSDVMQESGKCTFYIEALHEEFGLLGFHSGGSGEGVKIALLDRSRWEDLVDNAEFLELFVIEFGERLSSRSHDSL